MWPILHLLKTSQWFFKEIHMILTQTIHHSAGMMMMIKAMVRKRLFTCWLSQENGRKAQAPCWMWILPKTAYTV